MFLVAAEILSTQRHEIARVILKLVQFVFIYVFNYLLQVLINNNIILLDQLIHQRCHNLAGMLIIAITSHILLRMQNGISGLILNKSGLWFIKLANLIIRLVKFRIAHDFLGYKRDKATNLLVGVILETLVRL